MCVDQLQGLSQQISDLQRRVLNRLHVEYPERYLELLYEEAEAVRSEYRALAVAELTS